MTIRVIEKLSNSEYHSHPAISKSGLDEIAKSPLHYWNKYLNPERKAVEWTDAFTIGAALHTMVLEPQNFERDFIIQPDIDRRTKLGKEAYDSFIKQKADEQIVINNSQVELCGAMTKSVIDHKIASRYLDGFGKAEISIFFEWEGVDCRCRPDYIREDGIIVDVKTAACANPVIWPNKAYDFRYHVQTAFYSEGYRQAFGEQPKGFVFVVVEKSEPYNCCVFETTQQFRDAGTYEVLRDLELFRECKKQDLWPGYCDGRELTLDIPPWARSRYLEEIQE